MLDLKIDDAALVELGKRLGATEAEILEARNRAVRETQKQVDADVRKRIAQARIIRHTKLIRSRVRKGDSAHHGPDELHVWLGAREIPVDDAGKPRAYGRPGRSGGVKVGGHDIPGAFLAKVYKKSKGTVWMRLGSKHFDPTRYAFRHRRGGDRFGDRRDLRRRFPVGRPYRIIANEIARVAEQVRAGLPAAFNEEFSKQVRAQVFKGGAK